MRLSHQNKRPSLTVNAISNWFALGVNSIVSFVLTPILIQHLGKAGYGIWVLIVSITGYYGLLDMGIRSATVRYLALNIGKKDVSFLNRIICTSLTLYTILGMIVAAFSLIFSGFLSEFFNVADSDAVIFQNMIIIIGMGVAISFPRRVFEATLIAYERFVVWNSISILVSIARGVSIILLFHFKGRLIHLAWVQLATEALLIVLIALFVLLSKKVQINILPFKPSLKTARSLLIFGFFTFLIFLGDIFRVNIDTAIIGKYINMESVGIYGVAITLFRLLESAINACTHVLSPRLSMLAGYDMNMFRESYLKYSRLSSTIAAGLGLILIVISKDFINLWVGTGFEDAATVFLILGISLSVDLMTSVSNYAFRAINKHYYYAIQTIILSFVYLALKIALVDSLGLVGVALGTAIPLIVVKLCIQPIYTCYLIGVPVLKYLINVIFRPLVTSIFLAPLFILIVKIWKTDSFLNIALLFSQMTILYSLIALFTCLNGSERYSILTKYRDSQNIIKKYYV